MLQSYAESIVSKPKIEPKMAESSWFNIIESLDGYTNHNFAWEISSEVIVKDKETNDENIMTTVTLYIPGGIYTGRSLCFSKDYANNHLHALVDACTTFTAKIKNDSEQPKEQTNNNLQMSTDEIMNMVNSAAQADNFKDNHGRPTNEIPLDNITDKGQKDIHYEQNMTPHRDRYTQDEIAFLRQMQIDLNIQTPEEFGKYVHSWSKGKLSKKSDINPDNVTSFIEYIKSIMGETSN